MDFEIPSDLKDRIIKLLDKEILSKGNFLSEKELWELILRSVVTTLELLEKQEVTMLVNDSIREHRTKLKNGG